MKAKKSIYVKKEITEEMVASDVRFLQILVFKVESDWAYAMMLKARAG